MVLKYSTLKTRLKFEYDHKETSFDKGFFSQSFCVTGPGGFVAIIILSKYICTILIYEQYLQYAEYWVNHAVCKKWDKCLHSILYTV